MVSQDRLTRTYDECSKRPVFGDCAKSNGFSLERPKNRLQHLRPDGPHDAQGHQKADPSRQCGWKQAPGRSHRGSSRTVTAATVGLTGMAFSWKMLLCKGPGFLTVTHSFLLRSLALRPRPRQRRRGLSLSLALDMWLHTTSSY